MSHFVCLVLVDKANLDQVLTLEQLENEAEKLLARYDENLVVDEHEAECYCVQPESQADPNCDNCKGTGKYRTCYNPDSKWDWYTVGGRWSGCLDPDYDPEDDARNYELCRACGGSGINKKKAQAKCLQCDGTGIAVKFVQVQHDKGNFKPTCEIDEEFIPFAYVTPDGVWHKRAKMGWFGVAHDEQQQQDWHREFNQDKQAYANSTIAVVIDCHI